MPGRAVAIVFNTGEQLKNTRIPRGAAMASKPLFPCEAPVTASVRADGKRREATFDFSDWRRIRPLGPVHT
jgi:hypothetical protein